MPQMKITERLGRVSNGLSALCLIHCLALPFLVGVIPAIGLSFLQTEAAEKMIVWGAVALSLFSLCGGLRRHGRWWILAFTAAATAVFSIPFLSHEHTHEGHGSHVVFMVMGGVLLAAGNVINRKLCKTCSTCCDHAEGK
jgi:hypothetical protein